MPLRSYNYAPVLPVNVSLFFDKAAGRARKIRSGDETSCVMSGDQAGISICMLEQNYQQAFLASSKICSYVYQRHGMSNLLVPPAWASQQGYKDLSFYAFRSVGAWERD